MPAPGVVVRRELPSIFCAKCRRWVESQERVNPFATVDGVKVPISVWRCPECRGEAPVGTAFEAREVTQADISRDERFGPYRDVPAGAVALNPGGRSGRAVLVCGHSITVLPNIKRARCRKCRPRREAK